MEHYMRRSRRVVLRDQFATTLLFILVQLPVVSNRCSASTVYVQAGVSGSNEAPQIPNPQPFSYQDYWEQGTAGASAAGSLQGSSASASISLISRPGIFLATQGVATGSPSTGYWASQQDAVVEWRDIIRLNGTNPLPDSLALTFAISGSIGLSQSGSSSATAGVGLTLQPGFNELYPQTIDPGLIHSVSGTSGFAAAVQPIAYGSYITPFNVQGYAGPSVYTNPTTGDSSINGAVAWNAVFDVGYVVADGGYSFTLTAYNDSLSYLDGSKASVDFAHTIQLTAVTLADGSPISGGFTFDSGFQLSSVPEPSSFVLLASAMVVGVGWLSRRRR